MNALITEAEQAFTAEFNEPPDLLVHAPGRVNLIGEHTDYNHGFVLPCAIDYGTTVAARGRRDSKITVVAANYGRQRVQFQVDGPFHRDADASWSEYVRGVVRTMGDLGHRMSGVDLLIVGNVPQGAGLSSSASLEVAIALTLSKLHDLKLEPTDLARIGQRAENDFVGCQCGIMDQLVSAAAEDGCAALIDCRTLAISSVPLPKDVAVIIVNSNVQRGLVDSEYNLRRRQCEEAADILGVDALRDADLAALEASGKRLGDIAFRRARHVITENMRTLTVAEALRRGDLETVGRAMAASHRSLRVDFEVTVPAVDTLVSIMDGVIGGRGGVRMTGGGFGGCVVALVPTSLISTLEEAVLAAYPRATGYEPDFFACRPKLGARVVKT